ncbi:MAG: alpha/beta hydrolase family protein [Promethearchaeota archaeon]
MAFEFFLKSKYKRIIIVLFSITLSIFSLFFIAGAKNIENTKNELDSYLYSLDVGYKKLEIPTCDGVKISSYLFYEKSKFEQTNISIPLLIFIPGANSLKARFLDKKIQAVKLGFAVLAIEQRGHGESKGYNTLYGKEVQDISDIITYLEMNYPNLNTSHTSIIGFSLGGGTALGAQALDDRIYASVIYHPAANFSDIFRIIGINPFYYFGFLPGVDYPYPIKFGIHSWNYWKSFLDDALDIRNIINYITPQNTKNMLLLHGTDDDIVSPNVSQAVINRVDPYKNRTDVELIYREGLGHGGNENSKISYKYAMAWLSHFYFNSSINIANLEEEINYITLTEVNIPLNNDYKLHFLKAIIFLIISLFLLFYIIINYKSKNIIEKNRLIIKENGTDSSNSRNSIQNEDNQNSGYNRKTLTKDSLSLNSLNSLRIFLLRNVFILISFIITAILCLTFNPSLIYGIVYYSTWISALFLLLIPSNTCTTERQYNQNGISGKKNGLILLKQYMYYLKSDYSSILKREHVINFFRALITFIVPLGLYLPLYNLGGNLTLNTVVAPELIIVVRNISLYMSFFLIIPLSIRNLHEMPKKFLVLLPLFIFVGINLFYLFIPLTPMPLFPNIPAFAIGLILAIAIPIGYIIIYIILEIFNLFIKNKLITALFLSLLIAMLVWMRFMRII